MDAATRLDVYLRQNGTENAFSLTAGQCRRMHQKHRKGLETGGKTHRSPRHGERSAFLQAAKPAEAFGDFGPTPEPATVPIMSWEREAMNLCPRCKVSGNAPCVTPSGKATKTHKGRGE